MTVSVDAMGGDAGPGIVITALQRSIQRHPEVRFLLAGDESGYITGHIIPVDGGLGL